MARAIKAVLANRKMFRGGGLADTPPAASGILSSSSPLIDAVTADAVNPQGGGTLSMNQGGVARFADGGTIRKQIADDLLRLQQAVLQGDNQGAQQIQAEIAQKWGNKVDQHFPNRDLNAILAAAAGTEPDRLTSATSATPFPPAPPPGSVNVREEPAAVQRRLPIMMSPDAPTQPFPMSPLSPTRVSDDPFVAPPEPEMQAPVPVMAEPVGGTFNRQPAPMTLSPIPSIDPRSTVSPPMLQEPIAQSSPTVMERVDTMVPSQTPDLSTAIPTQGLFSTASYDVLPKPADARIILEQQRNPGTELVDRLFPAELQPGQLEQELVISQIAANTAAGEPVSRFEEFARKFGAAATEIAHNIGGNLAQDIMAGIDFAFDPETRDQSYSQIRGIAELIQRGQPEWKDDIINFGEIAREKGLTGDAFKADIAREISLKYEDTGPWTKFTTGSEVPPPDLGIGETLLRDAGTAIGEMLYGTQDEMTAEQANLESQIAEIQDARRKKTLAGVPVVETEPPPEEVETKVVETPDGTETVVAKTEVNGDVDQEKLAAALTAQGEYVSKRPGIQSRSEIEQANEATATQEALRIAANAPKGDQETLVKDIQVYVDRFVKAMPEYEGKSEYEKGMDIVKMGMAIAAGESPTAITNIAKGVLATIDNFTDDEKERRDYKRQVDFAAANYALASMEKDTARADAIAKENRTLWPDVFIATEPFTYNGVDYAKGNRILFSEGQLRSDAPLNKVKTEKFGIAELDEWGKQLRAAAAATAADLDRRTEAPKGFESSRKEFSENINIVQGNLAIRPLLLESAELLASDQVTGIGPTFQAFGQKLIDGFGGVENKNEFLALIADPSQAQFNANMQRVVSKSILAILKESNRTISTPDRERADQIAGAFTNLLDPAFANKEIMLDRLTTLLEDLDMDTQRALKAMAAQEDQWLGTINPGGKDYGRILQRTRPESFYEGVTVGGGPGALPGSVRWTDIVTEGKNELGESVFTYKPDWNKPR